jgi:hypothetical protein
MSTGRRTGTSYDVLTALRDGLSLSEGLEPRYPIHRRTLWALWLLLGVLLLAGVLVVLSYFEVVL